MKLIPSPKRQLFSWRQHRHWTFEKAWTRMRRLNRSNSSCHSRVLHNFVFTYNPAGTAMIRALPPQRSGSVRVDKAAQHVYTFYQRRCKIMRAAAYEQVASSDIFAWIYGETGAPSQFGHRYVQNEQARLGGRAESWRGRVHTLTQLVQQRLVQ